MEGLIVKMIMDRIVYQEVPNEVSLLFQISGCQLKCKGCHSPELWNKNFGTELSNDFYRERILKYEGLITCIVFFGGEWSPDELIEKLKIAREYNLKTCLYTGETRVSPNILEHLDFIKAGPWMEERGGLNSKSTNQIFINLNTGEKLNHLFQPKEYQATEMQHD